MLRLFISSKLPWRIGKLDCLETDYMELPAVTTKRREHLQTDLILFKTVLLVL